MSGLECVPLLGSVCDLGMDFSVGADLFGVCFLGYIFFFSSSFRFVRHAEEISDF